MTKGVQHLADAERALLSWGVTWHSAWEQKHGSGQASHCVFETADVDVGEGFHIHHVRHFRHASAEEVATPELGPPLVCLHGYGTGLGIFASSLPPLRAMWDGPLFALDLFGCGLSSRPKWKLGYGTRADVTTVENYFIERLEKWRIATGLDRMVLLGHSLGGYLSVCYALRYPDRVERLILVSPVGIPTRPETAANRLRNAPLLFRIAIRFWNRGWSPFTFVRLFGRRMLDRYGNRRYTRNVSWFQKDLLITYFYRNWLCGNISGGGYSHATLLMPGAWARSPLHLRFDSLQVKKVSFIYGTRDWMDASHAEALPAPRSQDTSIEIMRVADGSHNMMVDNPLGFAEAVSATCGVGAHGQIFGNSALSKQFDPKISVGDSVQARLDGQWCEVNVVQRHVDGTFEVSRRDAEGNTDVLCIGFHQLHLDGIASL